MKRRWFRRIETPERLARDPQVPIEEVIEAYQRAVAQRVEEGLKDIQESAVALMQEIASEVWRAGDADQLDLQERILSVLSRDAAIRGLIAHSDERYQSLDIKMSGVQDSLKSVNEVTEELRDLLDENVEGLQGGGGTPLDAEGMELLRRRLHGLQRYLSAVLQYQADRDRVMAEWLQKTLQQGQQVVRTEASRVIGELHDEIEGKADVAANRVLSRLEEQTRSLAYTLSVQEARLRLSVNEGHDDQTELLVEQIRAIEQIEADLTSTLDDRMARLAELTGATAAWAVDEVADRVGDRSTEAINLGVKDLLHVIDRRFAWLEETIQQRLTRLERALGVQAADVPDVEEPTVVPEHDEIIELTIQEELESARAGAGGRTREIS